MAKSGGLLNSICARLTTTKVQTDDDNGLVAMETEHSEDTDKENNNEPYVDNKELKDELKDIQEIKDSLNFKDGVKDSFKDTSFLDCDAGKIYENQNFGKLGYEPNESHDLSEKHHHTEPKEQSGRKNRRKNLKPMNIAQLDNYEIQEQSYNEDLSDFDELENDRIDEINGEYANYNIGNGTNNDDLTNDVIDDTAGVDNVDGDDAERHQNGEEILDLSNTDNGHSSIAIESEDQQQNGDNDESAIDNDDNAGDCGVLDLSVTKNAVFVMKNGHHGVENDQNQNGSHLTTDLIDDVDDNDDDDDELQSNEAQSNSDCNRAGQQEVPVDEAALKDYAQSTMSELLSMYGFGGEEVENIANKVPMHNFSSGKILERQRLQSEQAESPKNHRPSQLKLAINSKKAIALAQASLPESSIPGSKSPIGTRSPLIGSVSPLIRSRSSSPLTTGSGASSPTNSMSSEAYSKLIESSSRHSSFPQGKSPSKFSLNLSGEESPTKINASDYAQYMKRFFSYEQCKRAACKEMMLKEHYHCTECSYKVFMKKEDMIRHFKWHKKRAESLQYGFMRYSPTDDCSERYHDCIHNRKQTHYHCLQGGCDKVYISTSDVQMHANFHRKDSAIIQEGFQRFRATEDCKTVSCAFYQQRTTHFHCRRKGCSFTFKNKADMEKHKAYHQKDEILGKDGFKKFMKYEHCSFIGCRYSKVSNHIHCIRPGCDYVLHSTGQLYSHKRKHERRDFEHAYRRFKTTDAKPRNILPAAAHQQAQVITAAIAAKTIQQQQQRQAAINQSAVKQHQQQQQPIVITTPKQAIVTSNQNAEYIDLEDLPKMNKMEVNYSNAALINATVTTTPSTTVEIKGATDDLTDDDVTTKPTKSTLEKLASKISGSALGDSLTLPIPSGNGEDMKPLELTTDESKNGQPQNSGNPGSIPAFVPKISPPINDKKERDESWKKYLTRYTANDPCHPRCQFLYKDHYHCNVANCNMIFKSKDGVREHARYHDHQDRISSLSYKIGEENQECPVDPNCNYSKNLLHYHCLWPDCGSIITSKDPPFSRLEHHKIHEYARVACGKGVRPTNPNANQDHMKRRRGRPPKYPKSEIPVVPKVTMTDEEIQRALITDKKGLQASLVSGFKRFGIGEPCPDYNCVFYLKEHYHCIRARCHFSTDRVDVLNLHAKDFHNYITLLEGFEYFDPKIDCRRPHCHNNRANKHFHCTRTRCDYSFVRYSTMAQHDKKHKLAEMSKELSSPQMALPKNLGLQQLGLTLPITLPGSPAQASAMQQLLQNAALQSMGAVRDKDGNMIKTKGTFYPVNSPKNANQASTAQKQNQTLLNIAPKPNLTEQGMALPLTMLLQQKALNTVPQMDWLTLCMRMHYGQMQNCGRPFCKLKKKDHYHCFDCSQAFSDPDRLKLHIAKHGIRLEKVDSGLASSDEQQPKGTKRQHPEESFNEGLDLTVKKAPKVEKIEQQDQDDEIDPSSSLNLNPSTFSNLLNPNYLGKHYDEAAEESEEEEGALVMDFSKHGEEEEEGDEEDEEEDENLHHLKMKLQYSANSNGNNCNDDGIAMIGGYKNGSINDSMSEAIQDNDEHEGEVFEIAPIPEAISDNVSETASEAMSEAMSEAADAQVSFSRHSGRKRTAPKYEDFVNSDSLVTKQRKVSASSSEGGVAAAAAATSAIMLKLSPPKEKDENLPEGYAKYKFTEDCCYERCAYRLTNTHYHCTRAECGFSFSDRSRLTQHQQRHERYDSLMGDDFTQHRLHQSCERTGCDLSKKSSHFHCQRCDFACTDSSKVMAHRKQHEKLDNIAAFGFERVLGTVECKIPGCVNSMKQTHYHCLVEDCKQGVLGPSMMQSHQQKHNSA